MEPGRTFPDFLRFPFLFKTKGFGMGRENMGHWSVRKCSKVCDTCKKVFVDQEAIFSRLVFEQGEYRREDFCRKCRNTMGPGLSSWKTVYVVPLPPTEEAVKKETAESLLRKRIARDNADDRNAIFILAVMLERKKILVERDVQRVENGLKLRVYEHRKTGESFMVVDPELRLDELGQVQEEVVVLLGGKPRNADPLTSSAEPMGEG
jgi:hypothetical protein